MGDQPDAGEEECQHRQLKRDAERQQHARSKTKILTNTQRRLHPDRLVLLKKKSVRYRQNYFVAKTRTEKKKDTGKQHKRNHIAFLVLVQPRRDELPELIENYRARGKNRGDKRDFEFGEKGFCWSEADDRRRVGQLLQRPQEECEERRDEGVDRHESDCDREERLHNAPAQLFQMTQERHRPIILGHLMKMLLSVAPFWFARQ